MANTFSDGRGAALKRGFHPTNAVVDSIVGVIEQRRDLVDAQESISVEDERNEELTGSEFRIVEGCSERVSFGMTAVSTPDTWRVLGGLDGVITTIVTWGMLPGVLESPLDERIERLGAKLYSTSETSW